MMLLAMIADLNLDLEQMNVEIELLYGDLEKTIYMKQLKGFKVGGKEDYVCKLKIFVWSKIIPKEMEHEL